MDAPVLVRASRLVAKVNSAAVQDQLAQRLCQRNHWRIVAQGAEGCDGREPDECF